MTNSYTWFIATKEERSEALMGWAEPSEPQGEPFQREGSNPFTGETFLVWDWDPPKPTRYQDDALRAECGFLPHVVNGLSVDDLGALISVLSSWDAALASARIYWLEMIGSREQNEAVFWVPTDFTRILASADRSEAEVSRWAEASPNAFSPELRRQWLQELVALAQQAVTSHRDLYVIWEN